MKFFGKIYYTMDKQHPDWDHVIGKIQSQEYIHLTIYTALIQIFMIWKI